MERWCFPHPREDWTRVPKRRSTLRLGSTEYWLLGLEAKTVTVYVLENGEYSFVALYRSGETACSETLDDLTVRVDDLFQKLEGAVTWWNSFFRIKMERGKDGN
jgi:Uma2 family endonuclease